MKFSQESIGRFAQRIWSKYFICGNVLPYRLMAIFCLIFSLGPAWSADPEYEYMLLNGKSWHIDSIKNYNEQNFGAGYQKLVQNGAFSSGWTWSLFHDSYNHPSGYLGYVWQYRLVESGWHVDAGAVGLLMTRADVLSNLPFPAVLPYLSIGNRKYFANITLIPSWRDAKGIVFLQLGLRLKSNGALTGSLWRSNDVNAIVPQ